MSFARRDLHRGVVICLLIGAVLVGFFGLVLSVAAVSGRNFASGILLGGLGILLLLFSILIFVLVTQRGKLSRNGQGSRGK
jgi:hypothetical protein